MTGRYQLLQDAVAKKKEISLEVSRNNLERMVNNASSVSSADLQEAIFTALNAGLDEKSELYNDAGMQFYGKKVVTI